MKLQLRQYLLEIIAFMHLADLSHIYTVTSQLYLVIGYADVSFVQQQ